MQRGDGAAEVGYACRDGRTALAALYQRAPCRVLTPNPQPGDPPQAVLLNTAGGIAGGDRLAVTVRVEAGAAATATAQAAEKVYRSLGPAATVRTALSVGAGGWLDWLPQETILFQGARLDRRAAADVAPGGRLLGAETLVFGRRARGERFTDGLVHDGWRIRRDGRLVWADALRLDGTVAPLLDSPAGFAGAEAYATAFYVADDAPSHLPLARELTTREGLRAGATVVNGILLARWLGVADRVRAALADFLAALRHAAAGWPARLPRVWST
ncbi:MAG: urease accessory protein UreD [Rhodospirillales bacterium]